MGGAELGTCTAKLRSIPAGPEMDDQLPTYSNAAHPAPSSCGAVFQFLGHFYEAQLLQRRDAVIQSDLFDDFAVRET